MKELKIKNRDVIPILDEIDGETGRGLFAKRLPTRLLFALHRNIPEMESIYKVYLSSLNDICSRYGITPNELKSLEKFDQHKITEEVNELLDIESTVNVDTVPADVLEKCDEADYDALTFREVNALWWMLDSEKSE